MARHADREEIAQALVEDDLGGNPRIGAAQDDRERVLDLGDFEAALLPVVGMDELLGEVALVAFLQLHEGLIGTHGRMRGGGRSRGRGGDEAREGEQG
ncbi:hypothetical protein D3C87_1556630 [compost metagenome]